MVNLEGALYTLVPVCAFFAVGIGCICGIKWNRFRQAKAADRAAARAGPGGAPLSNAINSQYPPRLHAVHSLNGGSKLPAAAGDHPSSVLHGHQSSGAGPRASISAAEDHIGLTGGPGCHVVWEAGTEPMLTTATSKQQGLIGVAGRDVMKKLCAA